MKWSSQQLKNPHELEDKASRVKYMFASIAAGYDRANRLMSLNMDRKWRRTAIKLISPGPGESVLDICCGTGDMVFAMVDQQLSLKRIDGLDFVPEMLDIARKRQCKYAADVDNRYNYSNIRWIRADASALPYDYPQFDIVSCAFGIRNLQNPLEGLKQVFNALKPGGRLLILEFTIPRGILLRYAVLAYFKLVMPAIGSIIAGDKVGAYKYLPESIGSFNTEQTLEKCALDAGFENVCIKKMCLGSVLAFIAYKKQ